MKSTLKFLLYLIFSISLITGLNEIIRGASAIPGVTTLVGATVDNELRCALVFWVAYGIFCFWVAKNLDNRHRFIPVIALIVLLSGFARLLSVLLVGMPSYPLLAAMIVEFILSAVIYLSYQKFKNHMIN